MSNHPTPILWRLLRSAAGLAAYMVFAILLAACGGATAGGGEIGGYPPGSLLGAPSRAERPVVIYDDSGKELGTGQVRLLAPSAMRYTEAAKIRLEIAGIGAEATATLETETVTPVASQTLTIHEIMGAELQGVDKAHFTINAIPENGLRQVSVKDVTWWEWNIRPAGPDVAGDNFLQVLVYYPRTRADGTAFNEEVANFPITITVIGPATPTPTPPPGPIDRLTQGLDPIIKLAGAITAIAGAVGVLYGAYRFLAGRSKSRRSRK